MAEPVTSSISNLGAYFPAVFMDTVDSDRRLSCLFNPDQIDITKEAIYGELNPVGWSHTTQQYAHTVSASYSIEIVFNKSAAFYKQGKTAARNFDYAIKFFNFFLHGQVAGMSPNRLIFNCPHTIVTTNTLRRVEVSFKRWFQDMHLWEFGIMLDLVEDHAHAFYSSEAALSNGYINGRLGRAMGDAKTGSSIRRSKLGGG